MHCYRLDFEESDKITVTAIHYTKDGKTDEYIQLFEGDICIVTNGCMTDNAAIGDLKTKAPMIKEKPMSGELWTKISKKKNGLGNPKPSLENQKKLIGKVLHCYNEGE